MSKWSGNTIIFLFFLTILAGLSACIPVSSPPTAVPTTTVHLLILAPTIVPAPSEVPTKTPLAFPTEVITPQTTIDPQLLSPKIQITPSKSFQVTDLVGVTFNKEGDRIMAVTKNGINIYSVDKLSLVKSIATDDKRVDSSYNGFTETYSFNQSPDKEWLVLGQWAHYISSNGQLQRGEITIIQIGTGLVKIFGQDLTPSLLLAPFIHVRYTPDNLLIAGQMDYKGTGVQIWNLKNQLVYTLNVYQGLKALDFNPTADQLAICAANGSLEIHQTSTGALMGTLTKFTQDISTASCGLNYSHNGGLLAFYGDDQLIDLWDTHGPIVLRHLAGQDVPLNQILFSPDDQNLATLGSDGRVQVWNFSAHKDTFLWGDPQIGINNIQYSPDGRYLLGNDAAGNILIWNPSKNSFVARIKGENVVFSPDRNVMVTTSADGNISFWQTASLNTAQ